MPIVPQPKRRKILQNKIGFEWQRTDVEELEEPVQLSVITKAPEKYILIDMETGQVYVGSNMVNPYHEGYKVWVEQKLEGSKE
jgi:hypothetical protein